MARAAILYRNLADEGAVTASSWIAAAPPATLQDPHTTRRWKGRNGDAESITLSFSSAQLIDTVALIKCDGVFAGDQRTLSAAATRRVRIASADPTGVAGDLYDSGTAAGRIDPAYAALIELLDAPVSAIAVRIDLAESGAEALLAGRLVVGRREAFAFNFAFGWSFGFADLSRLKKSAGGQTFIDRDDRYRLLNVSFEWVNSAQRFGVVQEADRLNGISQDVLFVTNPKSDNLGRDSVWGLMQDLSPPTQPHFGFFAKSYSIAERL